MVQLRAPVKQTSFVMKMVLVQYALVRKEVMRVLWLIRTLDALLTIQNALPENASALELQLTQMQLEMVQSKGLAPVVQLSVNSMEHVEVLMI